MTIFLVCLRCREEPILWINTHRFSYALQTPAPEYQAAWDTVLQSWKTHLRRDPTFEQVQPGQPKPSWWKLKREWDYFQRKHRQPVASTSKTTRRKPRVHSVKSKPMSARRQTFRHKNPSPKPVRASLRRDAKKKPVYVEIGEEDEEDEGDEVDKEDEEVERDGQDEESEGDEEVRASEAVVVDTEDQVDEESVEESDGSTEDEVRARFDLGSRASRRISERQAAAGKGKEKGTGKGKDKVKARPRSPSVLYVGKGAVRS